MIKDILIHPLRDEYNYPICECINCKSLATHTVVWGTYPKWWMFCDKHLEIAKQKAKDIDEILGCSEQLSKFANSVKPLPPDIVNILELNRIKTQKLDNIFAFNDNIWHELDDSIVDMLYDKLTTINHVINNME